MKLIIFRVQFNMLESEWSGLKVSIISNAFTKQQIQNFYSLIMQKREFEKFSFFQ